MSWTKLIDPISTILDKFVPDKDEANRLAHEIATLAERQHHEQMLAQVEVNKIEAAHKSLFVAGWRPAVGWICATGLGISYILIPVLAAAQSIHMGKPVEPMDMTELLPILFGMLGFGAYRSYEKKNGIAREK